MVVAVVAWAAWAAWTSKSSPPVCYAKSPAKAGLFLFPRGWRGAGRSTFRPGVLSHLAPRGWLAFGFAGLGLRHRYLHLGVSRGDLGVHPRCSDSPPRSRRKAADAARVPIWPTAAPLVRNSPRVWTPRSLTTIRWSGRRAFARCRRRSRPYTEHQGDADAAAGTRWRVPGCRGPSSRLCRRVGISACLRACRRCRRALWLDPREPQGLGESSVPTLEASSAQVERP